MVVYNSKVVPDSKLIAQHYAKLRQVPESQILGLALPEGENISRADYAEKLEKPLLAFLESKKLLQFQDELQAGQGSAPGKILRRPVAASIRYLVLCYGVPVRILVDTNLAEVISEKQPPELRRNEAAVDSELALLPLSQYSRKLTGPAPNPVLAVTNADAIHPTKGVLMVARLDGPTPAIAQSLVDKAIQAEQNGFWGRAYFDARGLKEGTYKVGDDWIRSAADTARRQGFETLLDEGPATFSAGFPLAQIALYAGWYERHACGPFALPKVEFMPGAIAYHLHSFSAAPFRSTTEAWVGPLLAKGATATLGCVYEPYLEMTPDLSLFFSRMLVGRFTFGEAAYAAQRTLSWQTTVVGDPLYRPMPDDPQKLHERLTQAKNPLLEWSHLRVVNLNLATGVGASDMIPYLQEQPISKNSAVLQQKLGDLHILAGKVAEGAEYYLSAIKHKPSPQEKIHLQVALTKMLPILNRKEEALSIYQDFFKEHPDYPDRLFLYQKAAPLAAELGNKSLSEKYEKEVQRLSPPPGR